MKKNFLAITALAAMLFAGCTSSDELTTLESIKTADNTPTPVQFGTYLGKIGTTRAGFVGDITTDVLKNNTDGAKGFGVFAYFTGTNTYEQKNGTSSTLYPNFMYNEHVYFDTNWKYDNTKYWPNEIQNGDVDKNNNPDEATTTHGNGGKVSFFAYAPYVDHTTSLGSTGITAFTANNTAGDPKVTYVFAKTGKNVDLLWGTYYGTSADVLGTSLNNGILSNAATVNPRPITDRATVGWQKDILSDVVTTPTNYKMNADLVKQEKDGTVGFAFKHALSKVGGTSTTNPTNSAGLQIVLDADDVTAANAASNTVVTVENIKITTLPMTYLDDSGTEQSGANAKYITGGKFNLATGKWGDIQTSTTASDAIIHELTTSGTDVSGTLNAEIAEPTSVTSMTGTPLQVNGNVPGVTATAKNVYGTATSPMLFIPGCKPKFEIEITYYVRSFDSKLASSTPGLTKTGETGTWTNVKQTIKKTIEFANYTELNKRYTLVIHLGITSVKFTAEVSAWVDDSSGIDSDSNGTGDTNVVALPLNVE